MGLHLLREFIRENLGAMFGLDRHVTMNALSDVVGGPSPGTGSGPLGQPSLKDACLGSQETLGDSVLTRLRGNTIDGPDASGDDLDAVHDEGQPG